MDTVHDDRFMVFLRFDAAETISSSDAGERPVASCATYGEARRIRKALHNTGTGDCVIRFVGPAGGGD